MHGCELCPADGLYKWSGKYYCFGHQRDKIRCDKECPNEAEVFINNKWVCGAHVFSEQHSPTNFEVSQSQKANAGSIA